MESQFAHPEDGKGKNKKTALYVTKIGGSKGLSCPLSHLILTQSIYWLPTRCPKFEVTPAGQWDRYYHPHVREKETEGPSCGICPDHTVGQWLRWAERWQRGDALSFPASLVWARSTAGASQLAAVLTSLVNRAPGGYGHGLKS